MKHRIEMITDSPIGEDTVSITIQTDSPVATPTGLKAMSVLLSDLIQEHFEGVKHIRNFPVPADPQTDAPPSTN